MLRLNDIFIISRFFEHRMCPEVFVRYCQTCIWIGQGGRWSIPFPVQTFGKKGINVFSAFTRKWLGFRSPSAGWVQRQPIIDRRRHRSDRGQSDRPFTVHILQARGIALCRAVASKWLWFRPQSAGRWDSRLIIPSKMLSAARIIRWPIDYREVVATN